MTKSFYKFRTKFIILFSCDTDQVSFIPGINQVTGSKYCDFSFHVLASQISISENSTFLANIIYYCNGNGFGDSAPCSISNWIQIVILLFTCVMPADASNYGFPYQSLKIHDFSGFRYSSGFLPSAGLLAVYSTKPLLSRLSMRHRAYLTTGSYKSMSTH